MPAKHRLTPGAEPAVAALVDPDAPMPLEHQPAGFSHAIDDKERHI